MVIGVHPYSESWSGRPSDVPGTLTVDEAAAVLRVSARTVRRRIAAREAGDRAAWPTRVIRVGRLIRIPANELAAVIRGEAAA